MVLGDVHTAGINWESLLAIILSLLTVVGGFTAWLIKRTETTMEKIAVALGQRLDHIEDRVVELGERVARGEGTRRRGRAQ